MSVVPLLICDCQAIERLRRSASRTAPRSNFPQNHSLSIHNQTHVNIVMPRERAHRIHCYTHDLQSLGGKGYGAQGKGKGFGMKRVMGSPRDAINQGWHHTIMGGLSCFLELNSCYCKAYHVTYIFGTIALPAATVVV
jgi:hypothetical protein